MTNLTSVYECTAQWAESEQIPLRAEPEMTSSNELAKQAAGLDGKHLKIYLTDFQSKGRGRHDHQWESPPRGTALLSTWSYSLQDPPQALVSIRLGLALYRAARSTWPSLHWSLKAPNDLFLGPKKIAGLLTESISSGPNHRILVGLGMNVLSAPAEIDTATHLTGEEGLGGAEDEERWKQFLSQLRSELQKAIADAAARELPTNECDEVLTALNANPLKTEVFLELGPQGDLVTETQSLSWHQL